MRKARRAVIFNDLFDIVSRMLRVRLDLTACLDRQRVIRTGQLHLGIKAKKGVASPLL